MLHSNTGVYDMERAYTMKKITSLLTVLLVILAMFSGCGSNEVSTDTSADLPKETVDAQDNPIKNDEPAEKTPTVSEVLDGVSESNKILGFHISAFLSDGTTATLSFDGSDVIYEAIDKFGKKVTSTQSIIDWDWTKGSINLEDTGDWSRSTVENDDEYAYTYFFGPVEILILTNSDNIITRISFNSNTDDGGQNNVIFSKDTFLFEVIRVGNPAQVVYKRVNEHDWSTPLTIGGLEWKRGSSEEDKVRYS
jgi:hypothetical protein